MENKLPRKIEKPWGFELLFAHTPKYAGKLIFIRKEHRLSLQYHKEKDETLITFRGRPIYYLGRETSKFESFDADQIVSMKDKEE